MTSTIHQQPADRSPQATKPIDLPKILHGRGQTRFDYYECKWKNEHGYVYYVFPMYGDEYYVAFLKVVDKRHNKVKHPLSLKPGINLWRCDSRAEAGRKLRQVTR